MKCKYCNREVKAGHTARCSKNPKNIEKAEQTGPAADSIDKPKAPATAVDPEKIKPTNKLPEEVATLANPFGAPKVTSFERPYIDPTTHGKCPECDKKGNFTAAAKLPYFRGRFLCPVCGPVEGMDYTYDLFEGK